MTRNNRNSSTICLTAAFLTLMLAGNASIASDHNQTLGIVIGAATGGFLGSQLGNDGHYDRRHYRHDYRGRKYDRHRYYRRDYYHRGYDYPRYYHRNYNYNRSFAYPRYYRHNSFNRNYYRSPHGGDTTQLIATATGVFFGALIGSEIGRYMDDVDRMRAREANAMAQTAPISNQITWNNPQSNNSGSVTVTRDGYSESGKYCREFYQTVSIGSRTENAYGVACRKPDGAWQIVQTME